MSRLLLTIDLSIDLEDHSMRKRMLSDVIER